MTVKLPVKKCYYVVKVVILLGLVVSVLSLFEFWRGGGRNTLALGDEDEFDLEQQVRDDEARVVPGLGEGGEAAQLVGADLKKGELSEKKYAMNVYLSDRISYNRTLKDYRNPACSRVLYDAELPSVSVVIVFHNEPYSALLRTVWSVINSVRRDLPCYKRARYRKGMKLGYRGQRQDSPYLYLKEIILVDDNSTLPELKERLSHYVRTRLPAQLVRILRLPDRLGLTCARLAGAKAATAQVLVFLDAHCEVNTDWLRPLLQEITNKPHSLVTPNIDMISETDFRYLSGGYKKLEVIFEGGLTRARLAGAKHATGEVLMFLDAHCEVDTDWLRPLLASIAKRPHAVAVPIIDSIDSSTFYYSTQDPATFQVGGFTFAGHFTWIEVPEREKKRRGSDISPTWSPTMAGGLFAISRDYFWQLGAYDEQMAGWGGENLELSFRIWQCGGTLETVPCSRVGHVFRSFHPYGLPAASDTHGINTARMAEVWMDDYKELFYLHRPDLRNSPKIGDVTHRKILREKLQCKSFAWYLTHIYRDKFVPVRDVIAFGRFRHVATGLCLDTMQSDQDAAPLGLYPCHDVLQASQYYSLSLKGELRDEERCAEVEFARESGDHHPIQRRVVMLACHGKRRSQRWRLLSSGRIQHVESRLCLYAPEGGVAMATGCDADASTLKWNIDYNEDNNFALDKNNPTEQELKLRSLRGQKRVSRSLHSYSKSKHLKHHHKHHKKPRRSRFLLLVSHPGSKEHLHLEATCPHRTLRRNDTLMREVVTALTKHNLQVENNNRLFVGDRVVKLRPTASPNKHIIIEDFVEIPDPHAEPSTTDKNDSSDNDAGHQHAAKMRAEDKPDKRNESSSVIHRSKIIRPTASGVSLMLKTNLSFHLGDNFFWKRDKDPSSRENMSLLRTLSPPIPTLPPSDNEDEKQTEIDNETETDKIIQREADLKSEVDSETNTITDSEIDKKLEQETDHKTDSEKDMELSRETDIHSDIDIKSEKEINMITDSETDMKSDEEEKRDYKSDSETDTKSESEKNIKLKRKSVKKNILGRHLKITENDKKSGSESSKKPELESDNKTDSESDRKSGSESDRKSGSESDRKSGSESDKKRESDNDRKTGSESERKTESENDRKIDTESDRKTDTEIDRKIDTESDKKTDIETDFSNSIEINDKNIKSKLNKDYSDYDHS